LLHEPSIDRLQGRTTGPHIKALFERLAEDAEGTDCPCLDLIISYIDEDDEFVNGTYAPEMHLIVRRVDDEIA